ncbi:MAG: lysyl oxidase family protein [Patescibacteria group bacterium]|jgi:hypothetical protein
MKRFILLVSFVVSLVFAVVQFSRADKRFTQQQKPSDSLKEQGNLVLLLPDLVVLPPKELYIEPLLNGRKLRFSTTFINLGKGSLEIRGERDFENWRTQAFQKIYRENGTVEEKFIGTFVLHPSHGHWHIEDYVEFQLWNYDKNGKPIELLTTTNKMSFCIWDEEAYNLEVENAPKTQQYTGCNSDIQGISPGWSDTYRATVEGQELNISSIPDGRYLIRTIVNEDKKIWESNYDNNEARMWVEISGNTILEHNTL